MWLSIDHDLATLLWDENFNSYNVDYVEKRKKKAQSS